MEARAPGLLRIGSIAAGLPFLETLSDLWLAGQLHEDLPAPGDDPLALIDTTFLVPTRRAARQLATVITERLSERANAVLLPHIQPIGDPEDDLDPLSPDAQQEALEAAPPILSRLLLSRLIQSTARSVRAALQEADPSHQPVFSGRAADCAALAGDLLTLIDEVETAERDFSGLDALVPADLAAYWQISRQLVMIAGNAYPMLLKERGFIAPAALRAQRMQLESARLASDDGKGVTIAAGSTGSMPATARLLGQLAASRRAMVVLPGLDSSLGPTARDALAGSHDEAAAHPQYGMLALLRGLGAELDHVRELKPLEGLHRTRRIVVTNAYLPAEATGTGLAPEGVEGIEQAFSGLELIEAENESDEARAVAARLRLALEAGETPAICVTPDRLLARRIIAELLRHGIEIEDSAGEPMTKTPPGLVMRLVADLAFTGFQPINLLSLLKHPLAAFGLKRAECRRRARLLERAVLRGPQPAPGTAGLRAALAHSIKTRLDPKAHSPVLRKGIGEAEEAAILDLIERVEVAFAPLERLGDGPCDLSALVAGLEAVLQKVACDDEGEIRLFEGQAGEALGAFLKGLVEGAEPGLLIEPGEFAPLLIHLAGTASVRSGRPGDERIAVLGPLEARLLTARLTVLSGLNEGTWPQASTTDPFVSRSMRRALGLVSPERRIGLAAHDVEQVLCRDRVVLSRAKRQAGAPRNASRWWLRLETVLPAAVRTAAMARGDRVLAAARTLDRHSVASTGCARPGPGPTREIKLAKLSSLSITEIETLIRDPYALYARHILGLEPAPLIAEPPDARERGTVIHAIMERFIKQVADPRIEAAPMLLKTIADEVFEGLSAYPALRATWQNRFERVIDPIIAFERARYRARVTRHAEVRGRLVLEIDGAPFTLRGRADRIDCATPEDAEIIDYKTGSFASKKTFETGLSPQLPLEAAMLAGGAFEGIAPARADRLTFVKIGAGKEPFKQTTYQAGDLPHSVMSELEALVSLMRQDDYCFLAQRRPEPKRFPGDYDGLERLGEWMSDVDEEEDFE